MNGRKQLPHKRRSWTQSVTILEKPGMPGDRFYLSVGLYADGTPGELWVNANKEGTFVCGVLGALARMASFALQHGAPLDAVVRSLRGISFPPCGIVEGSAAVQECSSVPDWIARELEAEFLRPTNDATSEAVAVG